MADAFIVRRGAAASLNYEVVGSPEQPSNPKENTIWVNTLIDKEAVAEVSTERLSVYINNTSGKVTSPSSNTCYTRFFKCTAGQKYRFCLNDGQTVLIAGFAEKPAAGVVGTVLAGEGKTTGVESLDHTLTAETGMEYLAIWYYDSSTNDAVPNLRITDVGYMESLPDELAVTGHCFSADAPKDACDGLLWFRTGSLAQMPFNALKKNCAMLNPCSCAQYYKGRWLKRSVQSFIGGQWKAWRLYLFDNGLDNTEISGGYVAASSYGSFKIENGVLFARTKSGGTTGACRTVNALDLHGFNTLYFEVAQMNAGTFYLGVTATTDTAIENFVAVAMGSEESGTFAVDISDLNGNTLQGFYVVMRVAGGSTSKGIKLSAIYLE